MRLVGHCKGCPASEATLELAIKKALEETAPDLEGLEVEGVRRARAGAAPTGFELPVLNGNGSARRRRGRSSSPTCPPAGLHRAGDGRRRRPAGGERGRHAAGVPQRVRLVPARGSTARR